MTEIKIHNGETLIGCEVTAISITKNDELMVKINVTASDGSEYIIHNAKSAAEFLKKYLHFGDYVKLRAKVAYSGRSLWVEDAADIIELAQEALSDEPIDEEIRKLLMTETRTLRGKVHRTRTYENLQLSILVSPNHEYHVGIHGSSTAAGYIKENFHEGDDIEARVTLYRSATPPDSMNLFIKNKEDILKHVPKE